jgi:hypothetical protein
MTMTAYATALLALDLVDFWLLMAMHPDLAEIIEPGTRRRALGTNDGANHA